MGSSSSKFRQHLQNGDEFAALQVFQGSAELRKSLNPNSSYGDTLQHTPMLLVAKHAMKTLLKVFLHELGGNPNKCNSENANALHLACQGQILRSPSTRERRTECVSLLLQWQGSALENGERETIKLDAVDTNGNTALHYAAMTGLSRCVELLVSRSTPLFVENNNQETACDLAADKHQDIAQFLEFNMVFCPEGNELRDLETEEDNMENLGLKPQDILEAKDHLLVETSDMLHVPLFTAEALLRSHEWSRESLLEAWMSDPVKCCQQARIQPPSSALNFNCADTTSLQLSCSRLQLEYQSESLNSPTRLPAPKTDVLCEICVGNILPEENQVVVPCGHRFCHSCWKQYLSVKIEDGDAHSILCPDYECDQLVPIDIIEKIVSPHMVKRYLQFDIDAFVESNPHIKWCPYPGCSRAVRLADSEKNEEIATISPVIGIQPTSHAVDCGNGHQFCWECLGEVHAPCGCEHWNEWQQKIAKLKPEDLQSTLNKTEDAANCLWLVTNSKPCPNCKSPIQKNEGCNHMKCYKCKYDFCWVCLESWKKHNSSTGGYFRCNRYDAVLRAEEKAGELVNEASARSKELQDLKRFVHYYSRFKNHDNSYKLEEPWISSSRHKIEAMAVSLQDSSDLITDTFLEDAVNELLRSRRVLCGSYVYGYFLEDNGYNRTIFEFMQNDLEEATESLSEMVARHYLRSPKSAIVQGTLKMRRKRQEFVTSVLKGLIPPETPPSLRKNRRRRYPALLGLDPLEDQQMTQAIMASLEDIDPNNPWVKDANGKHTNLSAIFDWPDYDSDEETSANETLINILGICSRSGCTRLRARNPRTMEIHKYCSLRCSQRDRNRENDGENENFEMDYSMDMLIALEMSRLQMIEDMARADKDKINLEGSTSAIAFPEIEPTSDDVLEASASAIAVNPIWPSTSNIKSEEFDTTSFPSSALELNLPTFSNEIISEKPIIEVEQTEPSLDNNTTENVVKISDITFFLKSSETGEENDPNVNKNDPDKIKKSLFHGDKELPDS